MPRADAEQRPFLSGIVLAAGAATRMGRPKQILPVGDRPLLQHVLDEAAASRLDEIVLVLGCHADEIRRRIRMPSATPVRVVVNRHYEQGQSSSLRLGLQSTDARAAAAAVLLGDQPQVGAALVDRVASAFLASGAPAARPVYSGPGGRRIPGHPVFLARRIWPELETLRGDEGARALLSAHPEWLLEVEVDGEPPGDVDTPQDYGRALNARRNSGAGR